MEPNNYASLRSLLKQAQGEKTASLNPGEIIKLEKVLYAVLSLRTWCWQKYEKAVKEYLEKFKK
ncbi:20053_t:CDS:2 [Funneliformis geosporum]|nr:20053_t:CDS:2 [Funneliformis geosporum]